MKKILFGLMTFLASNAWAARVDSIAVTSAAMNRTVKTVVIIPGDTSPGPAIKYPVIYLLHGYGGNEQSWLSIKPGLPQIADERGVIFVCPDGENSWYLDSPLVNDSKYETFISAELVAYVDAHYPVRAGRSSRAVTGLSMGGHGALYNAFRHKDVFGAAGSTSGAVDIRRRGSNYGLVNLLGDPAAYRENWESHSVLRQTERIANGDLAIYIDCGVSDFCFPLNETLNRTLWEKGIDHEYHTRQGSHNHDYWNNAIDYHILFFCKFFAGNANP
jgi:S-formylglutathione hydrolase FrmB